MQQIHPNLELLMTLISIYVQVGSWRDRILIFTGIYGPTPALTKAFLDSGAKAVICPSSEPEELQLTSFYGAGEFSSYENGKFEIGDDEAEDEDNTEPSSPASDWEDSDPEKNGDHSMYFWDDDEKELSEFVNKLYDSVFQGGGVDAALRNALASHRNLRYSCHLPRTL